MKVINVWSKFRANILVLKRKVDENGCSLGFIVTIFFGQAVQGES